MPAPAGGLASAEPSALPAIGLALVAVCLFSASDALAKLLRQTLPAVEIAWLRYVLFACLSTALAARHGWAVLRPRRRGWQVVRGLAILGSALFFIIGLGRLGLAEATAIGFVSPAFITALSIPLLGEAVGIRRWGAIAVGLIGVLIVVRPANGALQAAAVFPLASALLWATAMVVTRRIGLADRAETTLFWTAATGLLVLTALVPFGFVTPTMREVGIGTALGVSASLGQFMVVLAYRRAPASLLAPFSYLQLLSAAALGAVVFGVLPDAATLVGASIIIGSGLYTAHRERVRARAR